MIFYIDTHKSTTRCLLVLNFIYVTCCVDLTFRNISGIFANNKYNNHNNNIKSSTQPRVLVCVCVHLTYCLSSKTSSPLVYVSPHFIFSTQEKNRFFFFVCHSLFVFYFFLCLCVSLKISLCFS